MLTYIVEKETNGTYMATIKNHNVGAKAMELFAPTEAQAINLALEEFKKYVISKIDDFTKKLKSGITYTGDYNPKKNGTVLSHLEQYKTQIITAHTFDQLIITTEGITAAMQLAETIASTRQNFYELNVLLSGLTGKHLKSNQQF